MAKSLRAKTANLHRRKKRTQEGSVYAAVDAERLERISKRLLAKGKATSGEVKEGEMAVEEEEEVEEDDSEMKEEAKKISTSGGRGSRREQWRVSKGMPARPKSKGQTSLGNAKGRYKAGKTKRRR